MTGTTDRGPGVPSASTPAAVLANGFARHVERWASALQLPATTVQTLRQVAQAVSLATSEGHVCLLLSDWNEATDATCRIGELRAELLGSGLVGTPQAPGAMPLILDAEHRLYLHRYFDYERRLARRLVRAAGIGPAGATAGVSMSEAVAVVPDLVRQAAVVTVPDDIRRHFRSDPSTSAGPVDWQRIAVALAWRQRLTIISGGPGTGKTTTVVQLLACLLAQDPGCRVALVAPTGKAAARMTQAIAQRAAQWPSDLRARLPTESYTVHRLLGVTPRPGGFVHDADHPLALDALVVDEASMLDLSLATRLLEAVPDAARIILLGDKDQLSAVEAGAVFSELCTDPTLTDTCRRDLALLCDVDAVDIVPPAPSRPSVLTDSVVWLETNFRFAPDSGIGRLARDINRARPTELIGRLRAGGDPSVQWHAEGGADPDSAGWLRLIDGYSTYFDAVLHDPRDRPAIVSAFSGFRALCAVRAGPRGVEAINERMTRHARERLAPLLATLPTEAGPAWYAGRPVMVLRNDRLLKLFNGDIGIALPNDERARSGADEDADEEADSGVVKEALTVWFADADGGLRGVSPQRLPPHETAYAMTVHKAQGSEFDHVWVLLPEHHSRVVTRELLYTAVTRARRQLTLCASAQVLTAALNAPTRRHSGLLARLREAAAEQNA